MKIAFVIYDGMTGMDFTGVYDPLTRLKSMGFLPDLRWDVCALKSPVKDGSGLTILPDRVSQPLSRYDIVIVPGGPNTRELIKNESITAWLKTVPTNALKASVCTGSLFWGAAGFLENRPATTHPRAYEDLLLYTSNVSTQRIVDDGDLITASGVTASIDLGLYLCAKLAGQESAEKIRQQMVYQLDPATDRVPADGPKPTLVSRLPTPGERTATVKRSTRETQIEVDLNLDGSGGAPVEVQTGLGFFDHMLHHVAVHGLFDLKVHAQGDLYVDAHHTVEDVALTLGQAFDRALGERAGIVRLGEATVPMDEALAFVAIDFSGRPYTNIQVEWHTPAIGPIATSLFDHFLESFAVAARCNLHARLLAGRDDHHQAEALFKALGRALSKAVQVDPRRQGAVPSTKGVLV